MTEQPSHYGQPQSAAEIALECHRLIDRLERHPLNVSLLLRARSGLLMVAGYKANRSTSDRLARPP